MQLALRSSIKSFMKFAGLSIQGCQATPPKHRHENLLHNSTKHIQQKLIALPATCDEGKHSHGELSLKVCIKS